MHVYPFSSALPCSYTLHFCIFIKVENVSLLTCWENLYFCVLYTSFYRLFARDFYRIFALLQGIYRLSVLHTFYFGSGIKILFYCGFVLHYNDKASNFRDIGSHQAAVWRWMFLEIAKTLRIYFKAEIKRGNYNLRTDCRQWNRKNLRLFLNKAKGNRLFLKEVWSITVDFFHDFSLNLLFIVEQN